MAEPTDRIHRLWQALTAMQAHLDEAYARLHDHQRQIRELQEQVKALRREGQNVDI
jgi:hypothetical protein